jgi:hypothetical protein
MERDFSKDLTIMVAGTGNVTRAHLEQTLGDWMFEDADSEREVHVILPLFTEMGPGIRNLIKLGMDWEFRFSVLQAGDAPMTRELSALPDDQITRYEDNREALEQGLDMLAQCHNGGDETAFIMAYNPKSTYEQDSYALSDFEIIGDAKNYRWLSTLNLCEGLLDSFEGYKSTDEILKEERLKEEFEAKKKAEEDAKPKPAKKATAPRKRAAKKAVAPQPKPAVEEPEKAIEDFPVGTVMEVAGTEFTKIGPNPFREPLPGNPNNELSATVPLTIGGPSDDMINVSTDLVRDNLAKPNTIAVSKDSLAQLSTDIRMLTDAFGHIMDTFTQILKDG